jgi:phosphoribosylformimino-5-aminoimidazole carboxamide ribotide isomerase
VLIIPVLDLKQGAVVRAQRGDRENYRPIVTPLASSADPVAVAAGLRSLHPFQTFYVADLDAIAGEAPNRAAISALATMQPPPELWIDAGIKDENTLTETLRDPLVHPVIGSESQRDLSVLQRYQGNPRLILSLDFFADGFRGPALLLDSPDLWPERVIVMTLAKVGSGAGPDLDRLGEVKEKAGNRAVFAAGGVRHEADLRALSELRIAGALVASSLHDGTITPEQLAMLGE